MRASHLKWFYILAATGLLLASARAEKVEVSASIAFHGTSTLHDFEGTVATAPFIATFREDAATGQLRVSASATINVLDMTTHHKKRDKKMLKMLDQSNFGKLTGVLTDALFKKEGTSEATLHLELHGVKQNIAATLSDWNREDDQVSCRMIFPISLKAFGLKPPSVMGLIRVGDTVTVECTLRGAVQ